MHRRMGQRHLGTLTLVFCALGLSACGVTSSQKTTRGPDSSNRDPRGSVEYCSDPERAKVDSSCGAKEDTSPVKVSVDGNPTLTVAAGSGLFIPISIALKDNNQQVASTTLTITSSSTSAIPTQSADVAGYASGTSFCLFVPASTAPSKYELKIRATSSITLEGGETQELASGTLTLPFQVTAAVSGSSGSAATVCPGTTIVSSTSENRASSSSP